MASFNDVVKMLVDGEQVAAGVTNRPTRQLEQNYRNLRDLFDAAIRGDTIIARQQIVEIDLVQGSPAFYNSVTGRFERALGAVEVDPATGAFITSASTQVWGIVYEKHSATSADILLHGMAELDLSAAVDGDITPGLYYLSNSEAGKLTKQRPPVGVTVLQVAGETDDDKHIVYVNTKFHDLLESHRHYKFTLQVLPAGDHTPPDIDEPHEITNPDTSVEGWLPADHAVFNDKAPAGAKFGYNLSVSKLKNLWPPQPVEGVDIQLFPGGDGEQLGVSVPVGLDQLVSVDRSGIWWMTDCYGLVPWAATYDSSASISESESEDCPPSLARKLLLWFTRPVFANTGTWVASLHAREGSGLLVTCLDTGEEATTGHLLIDLDLSLTLGEPTTEGHIALKGLEDRHLLRGPIVESIKPVGSNVTLTSNVTTGSDGQKYGQLELAVATDLNAGEVGIDVARLEGVEEQYFNNVIGLGFLAARNSSMRCRAVVPINLSLPTGTKFKLIMWVLNRSDLTIPAEIFGITYRRLPNPGSTPLDLPLNAAEVTLDSIPGDNLAVTATNQYVAIETAAVDVAAGDQLLFNIARDGAADDFTADLYVLRQFGVYVAAE